MNNTAMNELNRRRAQAKERRIGRLNSIKGLAVLLGLALLAIIALRPEDDPASRQSPALQVQAYEAGPLLSVTNNDSFAWHHVSIDLNSRYTMTVPIILSGENTKLALSAFVDGENRFDWVHTKPLSINIHADTPSGRADWLGHWK